ncbi:bifunctional riboflavin kinase/FAD synthetase [Neomoorella thermoacetica]|uniref:bifunctional riboflavin kinase/FAD synthetase n=1 Tax=Neomoorella thermoacetica TaxID=1525 RepID=UPI0008FB9F53|nr:bifunctional riboflavin kinase/FAD synthetase [Moorella thermoacetica]OIQ56186.1 riboflavin biosynthesis protein RibF [Moorella thermoacetica]
MQVWQGLPAERAMNGCNLALGNFDGVHRGHQHLIGSVVQKSRSGGGEGVVITFVPHPARVLEGSPPGLLTTTKRKIELIGQLGIDHLFLLPFTPSLAALEPEAFVREILWAHFHPSLVAVGFNFTFGHRGAGTPALLRRLGKELGFKVEVMGPVTLRGLTVSSTAIRNALENGDIGLARDLLGYWPVLAGRVVAGDQRGRQLGFPTANLAVPPELKLPAYGVYACLASFRGRKWQAVVNIGRRPTFGSALPATIEAHLLDFSGNLYNEEMELEFRAFLRQERKFASPGELKAQMEADREQARNILGGHRFSILEQRDRQA